MQSDLIDSERAKLERRWVQAFKLFRIVTLNIL